MYRPPRRPYNPYGGYVPRGPYVPVPRGAYNNQGYQPYPRPQYQAPIARHPFLDQLGVQNKFNFSEVDRKVLQVAQRHPRRLVPGDLISMKALYANKDKHELAIPLDKHITFNLKNTATCPPPEPVTTKPHDKDKTRYFVKVFLFSGVAPEDEKTKGKIHLSKRLNFLLAKREHGTVAPIGGEWSAEKDGATPNDAALKKTAIRVTKDFIGLDISKCTSWLKFLEFHYTREEGKTVTVHFLPNIWDHVEDGFEPATQTKEETKEVTKEVEEEEEDPEDPSKKKKVKKQVTSEETIKTVIWRPYEMSLHSMLEYDCSRPSTDDVIEFCIFADCFNDMLQRDFGLQVIEILQKKKEENEAQEAEKKRKREEDEAAAAEKKAKAENGEAVEKKEEEKKEEKKEEKPKMKLQHTVNQEILQPFQYFDRQPHTGMIAGSLRREVLEGTFHQYGTMTKNEIDDLLLKGAGVKPPVGAYSGPLSTLYYIKLATTTTEVPVEEEKKEEKAEDKEEEKEEKEEAAEEGGDEEPSDDATPTEASLNKLLLKDLRDMCTKKGLSTAGKKADLVERLLKGE